MDNHTNTKTSDTIAISQSEYSTLIPESISYKTSTIDCVVSQTARPVSVFEMENEKNELKRSIKLLNSGYVNQIESEIKKLLKDFTIVNLTLQKTYEKTKQYLDSIIRYHCIMQLIFIYIETFR